MDRDHDFEHESAIGEIEEIVEGLIARFRVRPLQGRHRSPTVMAAFSFGYGCVSIGLMSAAALLTAQPLVFPSLGPTAFLCFYSPTVPSASPRNTIIGHAIGVTAGWLCLVAFGLHDAGPALSAGLSWPRVLAAALSLGITSGAMVLLKAPHPPAAATTLIVSLGLLPHLEQLAVLMLGVVLLVAQAWVLNRLAGRYYPTWRPPTQRTQGRPAT